MLKFWKIQKNPQGKALKEPEKETKEKIASIIILKIKGRDRQMGGPWEEGFGIRFEKNLRKRNVGTLTVVSQLEVRIMLCWILTSQSNILSSCPSNSSTVQDRLRHSFIVSVLLSGGFTLNWLPKKL